MLFQIEYCESMITRAITSRVWYKWNDRLAMCNGYKFGLLLSDIELRNDTFLLQNVGQNQIGMENLRM